MEKAPKRLGRGTITLTSPPSFAGFACVAGKKEGEGPLGDTFDLVGEDSSFGEKTWEKAESRIQREAFQRAAAKARINTDDVEIIFAGDLINQCTASSFAARGRSSAFMGLYGACSTMAESLILAALAIDGGYASCTAAVTSSHFCSAEKQYRFPLEYGGQRTPTSQWTVTGAGCAILTSHSEPPYAVRVCPGRIVDYGIKDAGNMGSAMAPASAFYTQPAAVYP